MTAHGQKKQKTLRSLRATDDDLDEDVHVAEVVPDIDYDKILYVSYMRLFTLRIFYIVSFAFTLFYLP